MKTSYYGQTIMVGKNFFVMGSKTTQFTDKLIIIILLPIILEQGPRSVEGTHLTATLRSVPLSLKCLALLECSGSSVSLPPCVWLTSIWSPVP